MFLNMLPPIMKFKTQIPGYKGVYKFPITTQSSHLFFFLRVQRRYNKRRLAKARVYSRTSFFSSSALGAIFIAMFWNASHKGVDWKITLPYVLDVNIWLISLLMFFLFKIIKLSFVPILTRFNMKTKLRRSLQAWFVSWIINK